MYPSPIQGSRILLWYPTSNIEYGLLSSASRPRVGCGSSYIALNGRIVDRWFGRIDYQVNVALRRSY
ncbi:hypothetical protein OPQ81_005998 [Rhizoctonia solani]|nr:hypothetical protein OPQ81_005998 [Rhizoctonia solani]